MSAGAHNHSCIYCTKKVLLNYVLKNVASLCRSLNRNKDTGYLLRSGLKSNKMSNDKY